MSFSGAEVGIILGSFSGICFLCEIVRRLEGRHQAHADDRQELPRYSKNCPPENTGQEQGVIQDNEPHLAEQNDESFDEDARTIVEEENESDDSKYGVTRNGGRSLTEFNGQNTTEEDKDSFDGNGAIITGEEKDVSSVDLTERGYPGECYDVPKVLGREISGLEMMDPSTRKIMKEGNEREMSGRLLISKRTAIPGDDRNA